MAIFETLTPAERARQLANPEGEVGIAVVDWLNENNKQINTKAVEALAIEAGHHVLEIGFGNGRSVPIVMAQAPDVRYVGIDISPTMVAEASHFNADLVAAGKASFHLTSADALPFGNDSFDRVFSIGVVHFWTKPLASLSGVPRASSGRRDVHGMPGAKGCAGLCAKGIWLASARRLRVGCALPQGRLRRRRCPNRGLGPDNAKRRSG